MKNTQFIIVTGLSGSGKSLTQKCLEDMGFFCVDNLPTTLIPTFFELCTSTGEEFRRVAVVGDIRGRNFISQFPSVLEDIRRAGYNLSVLFLEADSEVLQRRFSESRRPHPLGANKPLATAIEEERQLLSGLRQKADIVIDTTKKNVHELRDLLKESFIDVAESRPMVITLSSFGYKYGIPYDSDLVFDVRFLPNPYFVEGLKRKTGLDPEVDAFIQADPGTEEFLQTLYSFLDFLVPRYIREGKSYLRISIGCTGGKHRSPAAVRHLKEHLEAQNYTVIVTHRDIERE